MKKVTKLRPREPRHVVGFYIKSSVDKKLTRLASKGFLSKSAIAEIALEEYLKGR